MLAPPSGKFVKQSWQCFKSLSNLYQIFVKYQKHSSLTDPPTWIQEALAHLKCLKRYVTTTSTKKIYHLCFELLNLCWCARVRFANDRNDVHLSKYVLVVQIIGRLQLCKGCALMWCSHPPSNPHNTEGVVVWEWVTLLWILLMKSMSRGFSPWPVGAMK